MIQFGNGRIALGDCLEVMQSIPAGSVDMILCDLPYGTTACSWDSVIPFAPLWSEYWRIAKPNAAIVLTAAQPFTSALIMSQIDRFRYEWIWDRVNKITDALSANNKPMRRHENVCVFYRSKPVYNKQYIMKPRISGGKRGKFGSAYEGDQYKRNGEPFQTSTVNDHPHNPNSIIAIKGRGGWEGLHPTQKPVALFEYLIRTYTNEGDTVMDNCLGSGTTAIAAENTGRRWIGIERDRGYFGAACERIARHVPA